MIEPSLKPTNASDYFLVSLRRMLVGKLPKEIFWNVYDKIKDYDTLHVVSEINILTLLRDS